MNEENQNEESQPVARPIQFPCLLWEPSLDVLLLCNEQGVGMVLKQGGSDVLKVGMIVPYAASRWSIGGEEWDFILPPPEFSITLRNVSGPGQRPLKLCIEFHGGLDE